MKWPDSDDLRQLELRELEEAALEGLADIRREQHVQAQQLRSTEELALWVFWLSVLNVVVTLSSFFWR